MIFQLNIRIGADGVADSKELALAIIDAASRLDHSNPSEVSEAGYFTVKYMGQHVGYGEIKQVLGTVAK